MAFSKEDKVGQFVNAALGGSKEGLTQKRLVELITYSLVPSVIDDHEVKPLVEGHLNDLRKNGMLIEETVFQIQFKD